MKEVGRSTVDAVGRCLAVTAGTSRTGFWRNCEKSDSDTFVSRHPGDRSRTDFLGRNAPRADNACDAAGSADPIDAAADAGYAADASTGDRTFDRHAVDAFVIGFAVDAVTDFEHTGANARRDAAAFRQSDAFDPGPGFAVHPVAVISVNSAGGAVSFNLDARPEFSDGGRRRSSRGRQQPGFLWNGGEAG